MFNINWKKLFDSITSEFLVAMAADMGVMWVLARYFGHKLPQPPADIDPANPHHVAHAAIYHLFPGPQSGIGDNAVFGSIINDSGINDEQRDILQEMFQLQKMQENNKKRYNDFRYSFCLIAGQDFNRAVKTLAKIGGEPTAQAAYQKAEDEGFLEPADQNKAVQAIENFFLKVWGALKSVGAQSGTEPLGTWLKRSLIIIPLLFTIGPRRIGRVVGRALGVTTATLATAVREVLGFAVAIVGCIVAALLLGVFYPTALPILTLLIILLACIEIFVLKSVIVGRGGRLARGMRAAVSLVIGAVVLFAVSASILRWTLPDVRDRVANIFDKKKIVVQAQNIRDSAENDELEKMKQDIQNMKDAGASTELIRAAEAKLEETADRKAATSASTGVTNQSTPSSRSIQLTTQPPTPPSAPEDEAPLITGIPEEAAPLADDGRLREQMEQPLASQGLKLESNLIVHGCEELPNRRAVEAKQPVSIQLTNYSPSTIPLQWIDRHGEIKDYGQLDASTERPANLYLTYPVVFRTPQGGCLGIVQPDTDDNPANPYVKINY